MARKPKAPTQVKTHRHQDKRTNIPPAEMEPLMAEEDKSPIRVAYERRNRDLDPQLVWRGKDEQDWSDLVVQAPPLYIQEKVHPKVLIDDLLRETADRKEEEAPETPDLFGDFNGLPDAEAAAEFYQHQANWTNRMILGDSLSVMASLAEREGLRGKVQCIYLDPPYGIKFNSNFQWSTTTRDVTDGKLEHVTREPEMVKAFRDTWRDGIHTYLTYLRDRLTVTRDLLHSSGSVFMQIGDENVHRIRAVMDEVFGDENLISIITVQKAGSTFSQYLGGIADFVLWYAKEREKLKYRKLYASRSVTEEDTGRFTQAEIAPGYRVPVKSLDRTPTLDELVAPDPLQSASMGREKGEGAASWFPVEIDGREFKPTMQSRWKTNEIGMGRLLMADRVLPQKTSIRYKRKLSDFPVSVLANIWTDLAGATDKIYVVQTNTKIVERCMLMATDPSDLILDPTCGSGTTAYVAEQWGRRWITVDTSRVALALARSRVMGARYPYYHLRDTEAGVRKEAELRRTPPSEDRLIEVQGKEHKPNIRQGFVYERVPHISLRDIASNSEIDVIWDEFQENVEPLRERLNAALGQSWEDWEIPREADQDWSDDARQAHTDWWEQRRARQKKIDASIAAKADYEYLYDKPYADSGKIRVAGPFTVESLSPHRTLAVDHDDELVDTLDAANGDHEAPGEEIDFATMVLENLKTSGVQQMDKGDRITFSTLTPWPGHFIAAEGRYQEGEDGPERRAGIFIGPEFGTVQRADLTAAARECAEAGFDILVACAFSFSAQCTDLNKLGALQILRARMNPDLHMADDLKNTGTGNLFVVFGEPDIEIIPDGDQVKVQIHGVDVFKPQTGEIESSGPDSIACWFIDTDYNEESFFVRHAYFLGASDPYKALKTTLKAEIDAEAWESLHSDVSRPFDKPKTGRIAIKVINHLGDEVMKVFGV